MAKGYDVSITITTQWREGGKPPSPQKIERIKKPIRDLNTEIRKQQGLLSRFYNNWKSTFAVFAAGYASVVLFLGAMRALSNTITGGIKKIAEFEASVASLTARLISLIRTKPGESLSAGWERISNYVKDVYTWAVKLDAQFIGTAEELMEAFKALADQGIILNVQSEEHRKAWLAIAAAAKAANPHIQRQGQIYQEIRGFIQHITRQGNELARQAKAMIPNYEKQVELLSSADEWAKFLNTHFLGYLVLSQKIGQTWDAIVATFGSYFSLLQRFGLRPLFETLKNIILDMANYLREHLVPLSANFAIIWREISPAIRLVADIFGIIFKTISAISPVIAAISHVIGTLASLFRVPLKLFSLMLDKLIDYEGQLIRIENQQKRTFTITETERKLLELRKKEEKIDLAKPLQLAKEAEFELLAAAKSATYARLELKRREIKAEMEKTKTKIKMLLEERQLEQKLAQERKEEAEKERKKWESDYNKWVKLNSELSQLQQRLYRMPLGGGAEAGEIMSRINQIKPKILELSESLNKYNKAQEDYTKNSEKAKQAEQKIVELRGKLTILNKYLALVTKQLTEEDERLRKEKEEGTKKEISNIQKIRDAYNALLMDYERYESQRKEISQEMATERLRIEAKLTGSLEDQYKYRMKQVEEWETQKLNRVLSIRNAMLKKIEAMARRIREEAAKEGRTSLDQLTQEELKMLVNLVKKRVQVEKDAEDAINAIRRAGADKGKEIFRDIYTYSIDLAQTFQNTISDAFEGIVLGTRKLSDVFKAMRDALVREFATGLAGMITKKIEWEKTLIGNLEINLPKAFGNPLEKIKSIWSSAMDWLKGSTGKLLGALGTATYGIAGMVGSEPWRAIGGAGATAALFTGHPVIAMATITAAEIGRAIFKGRVEWVGVGAGAAGIPITQIGLRRGIPMRPILGAGMLAGGALGAIGGQTLGAVGAALGGTGGTLGAMLGGAAFGAGIGLAVAGIVSLFTSMFSRKWPTIRGTAEISLKGLSDSLDYVEGYMREIEKYLDEHTEIYAMYKTKFARITIMEKRDVKGSMDEITQAFGSFVDDLVDFYQSILPSTMRFEELPSIKMTFGAGKKNMENLAKQFVNELVSQTYNAWAVPIVEEYNRLLGMDLFEKFGLPKIGELVGGIGHRWNEQMKKLYERLSREVLPSLGVAFTYAKTIMNLVDKYGEGLVGIYKDEIANELVNMLEKYKGEVQGLKEEEVKKKAEEFGQTVNEYLSTVVSIIGEIEDIIAQYTLSSFEQNLREIRSWYQEKLAELTSLGLSTERLLLAVTLKIKNLIEQSVIAPLKSLYVSIQQFRLPEPAFVSWQVAQLETKWGPIWGDIDALAGRWDELIADASTYFSLLQRQFEFEAQAIRARAEERKAQIRTEAEAQRAVMQERLNGIQEETSALREQKRELESIKEQWKGVIDSIKQRLQELQFGPEAPVQSWAAYQVKWAELVEAAKTSPEAAQELIEFSKRYLEIAKIYAPSQYLDIWQQVVSTLQDVENNAVSEIDLLQTQIDAIERQTEALENRARDIERSMNNIGSDLSARLAAIDAQAEQQITLLRQEYANRMMAIHDRLREVGEYLAKQIEEQMPEDIRLLTATANWLEKIYNYLTGVPSAQTGGVTTREGLYHLHAGETILPRNTNIKVEIDSDKLGKSIASSLLSAGVTSGSGSQSIHLHIDGREIATVTAEQMRRGHSELIKQVRRVSH